VQLVARLGYSLVLCCCYVPRDYSVLLKSYHTHANCLVCLHGYDLPTAAQTAHVRLGNNMWAQVLLNDNGVFIVFLSKLQVATLTGISLYMFLETGNEGNSTNHTYGSWIVVTIVIILGWTCASIVLALYSSVSTALAACLMEDREFNEANGHKTFGPAGLKKTFNVPPGLRRYAEVFGGAGLLIDRITGNYIKRSTNEFFSVPVSGEEAGRTVGQLVDASLSMKRQTHEVTEQMRANLLLLVPRVSAPQRLTIAGRIDAPTASDSGGTRAGQHIGRSEASREPKAPPTPRIGLVSTLVATAEAFHQHASDDLSPLELEAWSLTLQNNLGPVIQELFGVTPVEFLTSVVGLINLHDHTHMNSEAMVDLIAPTIANDFGVDLQAARFAASFVVLIAVASNDHAVLGSQIRLLADTALMFTKDRLHGIVSGTEAATSTEPHGSRLAETRSQSAAAAHSRGRRPVRIYEDIPSGTWGRATEV